MLVAVALVSDQNVAAIVAIANFVHFRCDVLNINFHIAKVCFRFLKKKKGSFCSFFYFRHYTQIISSGLKDYLQGFLLDSRAQVSVVCKESFGVDTINTQIREFKNTRWIIVSCGYGCDEE